MVSALVIEAAEAAEAASSSSRQHPSPSSQQEKSSQRQLPSRTQPQQRLLNPLPRFFTTASAIDQAENATTNPPNDLTAHGFLPPTTQLNLFKNWVRVALKKTDPPATEAYWADVDKRYEKIDCTRCETDRDYLLRYSPIIRYMNDNIRRLGGDLNSTNIRCKTCIKKTDRMYGGFDAQYGIKICANYVENRKMLEDVMAHEMVHAYDHLRFKVDLGPEEDLRKVACSEIRASNLGGECRWANEFFGNGVFKFTNHQQECVRRRAVRSVMRMPQCKDDVQAVKAVNEVWDSCFRDTRPFDEIFR